MPMSARRSSAAWRLSGFSFRRKDRSFVRMEVPVHRVTSAPAREPTREFECIEDIVVVALADLINMKLRTGMERMTRAIDLADVIGLIRCRKLTPAFASKLDRDMRSTFRKLARAVQGESADRG